MQSSGPVVDLLEGPKKKKHLLHGCALHSATQAIENEGLKRCRSAQIEGGDKSCAVSLQPVCPEPFVVMCHTPARLSASWSGQQQTQLVDWGSSCMLFLLLYISASSYSHCSSTASAWQSSPIHTPVDPCRKHLRWTWCLGHTVYPFIVSISSVCSFHPSPRFSVVIFLTNSSPERHHWPVYDAILCATDCYCWTAVEH